MRERHRRDRSHRRRRFLLFAQILNAQHNYFRDRLSLEGRQRRDRRIPRESLLPPALSPWARLYASRNDAALITVTGFDHPAFEALLALFDAWFYNHTPWTGNRDGTTYVSLPRASTGRHRLLDSKDCLGLVLAWYRFRGPEYILQGWFGFTGTHANVWLKFGRRGLLKCLQDHPDAKVMIPSDEHIGALKRVVQERHDRLTDVFAVADGCKFCFESCADLDEQSMYYNGWKCDHYVTNLFVFAVDGRCIMAVVNAPGSLHDSTLAEWGGVYEELEEVYHRTGAKVCVDSAFTSSNNDFIIKSAQNFNSAEVSGDILVIEQATSLRQAAEWGMRAVQSAFPRLYDRIKYEENGERGVYLSLLPLLYNFRLEKVGLNQIRNVYCPSWSTDSSFFINEEDVIEE
jgi:DDE superfamily endonuclease